MQPVRVGDLRGRVPGLLPDAAGGSGERGHFWHEQQNTAAYNFQTIDPVPSPRPEPGVHSSPQTRSDLLPARPTLQRRREEVKQESTKTKFNFQLSTKASFKLRKRNFK